MEFKVQCKRKRSNFQNINASPLPLSESGDSKYEYQGVFTGFSVEVTQADQMQSLYANGCFGKGSKSRGGPESGAVDESLLLGLEEACFLAYILEILQIKNRSGQDMKWNDFLNLSLELDDRFLEHLAAYVYLKSKNWVVKSGIKFGGDYLIYKESPRSFHASCLVLVQKPNDKDYYMPKNLKGVQRVAETSDKDVLILSVTASTEHQHTQSAKDAIQALTIQETVIRRFNHSSFVQKQK